MTTEQIQKDLNSALKNRDSVRVSVLRLVNSEIKNREIELRTSGGEINKAEIEKIFQKEGKKRKESIEAYEKAGRTELVDQEKAELAIIEEYLPEQMSKEDVKSIVQEVISGMDNAQFGQVMGQVMAKVQGRADGKLVGEVVKGILQ